MLLEFICFSELKRKRWRPSLPGRVCWGTPWARSPACGSWLSSAQEGQAAKGTLGLRSPRQNQHHGVMLRTTHYGSGLIFQSHHESGILVLKGCTGFHRLHGAEDALAAAPQAAAVTCRPGGCQQPRAPAGWRAGTPITLVLHMGWKPQQQTCAWEDSFPRQSALVPHEITAAFAQEQTQVSTFSTMLHGNFPHPAYI